MWHRISLRADRYRLFPLSPITTQWQILSLFRLFFPSTHNFKHFLHKPSHASICLTLSTLASINSQVTFVWIRGHTDLPDHDAVNIPAKEATEICDISLAVSDYKTISVHLFSTHGIISGKANHNKLYSIKDNPSLGQPSIEILDASEYNPYSSQSRTYSTHAFLLT